uniref:p23 n=1 Tax=Cladocopium sp. C3 TaxID=2558455 RepID=Q0R0F0_9DINO|nr:p23 [Cladocopium sp. C3]
MSRGYAAQGPRLQPSVLWAQRKDSVFVTVDIKDASDVHFQLEEACLDFAAKGGEDGSAYAFHLELYAPIRREDSKFSTKRCPMFFLRKSSADNWPRLQKEGKLPWVKIDWNRWEEDKGAFDTGDLEGMDFGGLSKEDVEGSDDRDSILADLDEDIAVLTDEEAQ